MFRVLVSIKSNNILKFKKTEKLISVAVKQKSDFILTPEYLLYFH